jgi:rare lipoprotein A
MKFWTWIVLAGGVLFLMSRRASATTPSDPGQSPAPPSSENFEVASFYGPGFDGKLTANGEIFDQNALTAAHRTLPFNTHVRVTDVDNGRSVVVRINDRGPFTKKNGVFARSIDLSVGSAAAIGLDINRGLARVRLERLN